MDLMKCEAISGFGKIEFRDSIEGITEWPHKIPDGEVSYRVDNFTMDFLARWQMRAVKSSFLAWQLRIKNLKFRYEKNPDVHVDIPISFAPSDHFRSEHVFAHAIYPGQGVPMVIEINDDDWFWVVGSFVQDLAHPPLMPVLIHEIGHSLGLVHDPLTFSMHTEIMYPSFNLGRKKDALGPRTVLRIQDLYGIRNISQRLIDYFLLRRQRGYKFR